MAHDDLLPNLNSFETNVIKAIGISGKLDEELEKIIEGLSTSKEIAEDLKKIKDYMQLSILTMEALSLFPQIHDKADDLKTVLNKFKDPIDKAAKTAGKFE